MPVSRRHTFGIKQCLKSESGAGLVTVMMVSAIMISVFLGTVYVDSERKKIGRSELVSSRVSEMFELISYLMSDVNVCNQNFSGVSDGGAPLGNRIVSIGGATLINLGGGAVTDIERAYDGVRLHDVRVNLADSTLRLTFQRLGAGQGGQLYGAEFVVKDLHMKYGIAGGNVNRCYSDSSEIVADFCETYLGGSFSDSRCRNLNLSGNLNILAHGGSPGTLSGGGSGVFSNAFAQTSFTRNSAATVSVNASGTLGANFINLPNHQLSAGGNLMVNTTIDPTVNVHSNGVLRIWGTSRTRTSSMVPTGSGPCQGVVDSGMFDCSGGFPSGYGP